MNWVGVGRLGMWVAVAGWFSGCAGKSEGDGEDGSSGGTPATCEAIVTRGPCEAAGCATFIAGTVELSRSGNLCDVIAIDEASPDALGVCSSDVVAQQGAPGTLVNAATGHTLGFAGVPAGAGLGDWSPCDCDETTACGCADECQAQPPATSTGSGSSTGAGSSTGG